MGLGMGTVFLFLIILIVMMNLMSTIIHKFFPEPHQNTDVQSKTNNNTKIVAAISAAIKHHRES